jgi:hypothetical protein
MDAPTGAEQGLSARRCFASLRYSSRADHPALRHGDGRAIACSVCSRGRRAQRVVGGMRCGVVLEPPARLRHLRLPPVAERPFETEAVITPDAACRLERRRHRALRQAPSGIVQVEVPADLESLDVLARDPRLVVTATPATVPRSRARLAEILACARPGTYVA